MDSAPDARRAQAALVQAGRIIASHLNKLVDCAGASGLSCAVPALNVARMPHAHPSIAGLSTWTSRFLPSGASGHPVAPSAPAESEATIEDTSVPHVEIYLLSRFRVFANDRAIEDWPNCKGRAIFKYLATHRSQPVPREVLMEVFWPDSDQDAARNNLNVAIYGLRKALARADPDYSFVLFRQGCYSFNPALRLWVDAEAFVDCIHRAQAADQQGDTAGAIAKYRVAQAVYHSALLVDDRYEDWLIPQRQQLQDCYLKVLGRLGAHYFEHDDFEACVGVTGKTLEVDNCNENAHRLMMRCYGRMGHAHLALRQYHFCVDALSRELNLIPSPQTVALFQQIRHRQPI
jgi:DNA-binding SARP family transcriptional activator